MVFVLMHYQIQVYNIVSYIDVHFPGYVYYPDQYIGLPSDYYVYEYEVITNITCPPGATSYLSCYYTTGYGGCYENGGQAVISCLSKLFTIIYNV